MAESSLDARNGHGGRHSTDRLMWPLDKSHGGAQERDSDWEGPTSTAAPEALAATRSAGAGLQQGWRLWGSSPTPQALRYICRRAAGGTRKLAK
jgi:hypothetical protein